MVHLLSANAKSIKTRMVGLVMECPIGGNPEDCQFHDIRALPFRDKFAWVENLTDDEREVIYLAHSECMRRKLTPE